MKGNGTKITALYCRLSQDDGNIGDSMSIPKFIFYALGYAIERVLSMSRKGINGFYTKKVKSQQLNLFEHFKIGDTGAFAF